MGERARVNEMLLQDRCVCVFLCVRRRVATESGADSHAYFGMHAGCGTHGSRAADVSGVRSASFPTRQLGLGGAGSLHPRGPGAAALLHQPATAPAAKGQEGGHPLRLAGGGRQRHRHF